ncbi:hypothetical protein LX36DRAFT_438835 [Colletotrichum falcatum]|nr:hypothetical protein LX36DRAFT_438835 [Colletotrichum falcatum]
MGSTSAVPRRPEPRAGSGVTGAGTKPGRRRRQARTAHTEPPTSPCRRRRRRRPAPVQRRGRWRTQEFQGRNRRCLGSSVANLETTREGDASRRLISKYYLACSVYHVAWPDSGGWALNFREKEREGGGGGRRKKAKMDRVRIRMHNSFFHRICHCRTFL